MEISNVIFLLEVPFSLRDEDRFGVQILQKRGLRVEVWDVSDLYLPRRALSFTEDSSTIQVTVVTREAQLKSLAESLSAETVIFVQSGVQGTRVRNSHSAIRQVMQTKAKLATISVGHMAPTHDPSLSRIRSLVGAMKSQLLRFVGSAMSSLEGPTKGSRKLDYVWAGTNTLDVRPRLVGRNTRRRIVHTFDYDIYLNKKKDSFEFQRPFIALLHALGPSHPDRTLFGTHGDVSAHEFLQEFRKIATWVEESSGMPVVIAAHPRTPRGSLDDVLANFRLTYGETAQVVAQASHVVGINYSTATSFAVLNRRPLTLVRSRVLQDSALRRAEVEMLCELLSCNLVSAYQPGIDWKSTKVDEEAYCMFEQEYIKKPGTPERPFWEVVADDLVNGSITKLDP